MSIGPSRSIGSLAGSQLPQTKGTDVDRVQQDAADQVRQIQSEERAESASGIGEMQEEEQASERDVDGRQLWEQRNPENDEGGVPPGGGDTDGAPKSRDAMGQSGNNLDLSV